MLKIIKIIITLVLFTCLCSCTTHTIAPKEYIQHINGYWEIEKVVCIDGTEKHYNFSQNIDFFEFKDTIGIRKKVQPKLNGHFITSKDNITFSYAVENDSLRLYFKSEYQEWKETVLFAKEKQMVLKNETGNLYFYKPYQKLDL